MFLITENKPTAQNKELGARPFVVGEVGVANPGTDAQADLNGK